MEFLFLLLLLSATTLGLAWPLARRLDLASDEKVVVSVALSLLGLFLIGGIAYAAALPVATLWLAPTLATIGLALDRRSLAAVLQEPPVRALLIAQLLLTAWCIGWLTLVISYSGGGWSGDWFEHWERARFFLDRGPLDYRFLGMYTLPARPPLANVVTATFLAVTRGDFAHYQVISTFFSSLAFLPAALLARRFSPVGFEIRVIALLAVFFAVNPLFVQNATFAWTKLPAALCVLTALYFLLRAHDPAPPRAAPLLFATTLATGLLIHYSAGPAAVVLAFVWAVLGWQRRYEAAWWRQTLAAAFVGAAILGTWFCWSYLHYGFAGTFLSNTSVTASGGRAGNQLLKILLNLRDTVVPHFLRPLDSSLIAQPNPWSALRDWFFQIYQLNLPLAFGSVAGVALAKEAWRVGSATARATRVLWIAALSALVVLGVAVLGERDHWGLTHICLQGFVLLGLAFLAARWTHLGRGWKIALGAGALVDFFAGVALHFAAQNFALGRWFAQHNNPADVYNSYSQTAFWNLVAKTKLNFSFAGDLSPLPPAVALVFLTAILALMISRARAAAP